MQYPDSHTMPFSTVFLGANSRVARRVAGYWPKPPGGGENLLKLARNGTDLTWNMDEAPPSLPQVAGPVVMVCFAGVTPKGGGPLEQNRALALAAHRAARAWGVLLAMILKVGQQSLAVFIFSMFFARLSGFVMDQIGRTTWNMTLANLVGFAALIALAYAVSWVKSQPWRVAL